MMFCEVSGDFVIGISSASALNEDEGEGCSGSYQVDPNSLPFTLRRVDRQWEVKCSADEFSLFPDQITSTALADGERPASKVLAFLRQFEKQNEQKAKIASSRAKIVEQLNKIGWNRVSSCNEDLRSVSFMFTDCDQRQIWLEMKLSLDDFPASPPVCSGNFPGQFEFFWDGCTSLLSGVLDAFEELVESLKAFWDEMDEMDARFWVLHPKGDVSYAETQRRIGLDAKTSFLVVVDPSQPRAIPHMTLIGPEHEKSQFHQLLNANYDRWDESRSLCDNLELLFGTLPGPTNSQMTSVTGRLCLICQDDDSSAPLDTSCQHCDVGYHQQCLRNWLMRKCKQHSMRLGFLVGPCVHCGEGSRDDGTVIKLG